MGFSDGSCPPGSEVGDLLGVEVCSPVVAELQALGGDFACECREFGKFLPGKRGKARFTFEVRFQAVHRGLERVKRVVIEEVVLAARFVGVVRARGHV